MIGNSQAGSWLDSPRWLPALILVVAVAVAYGNALDGPFFFDDTESIVENPAIRRLWPLSAALNPPPGEMTFCTRPLANLTLCVNYAMGGRQVRGYRIANVLFHTAAALSLFGFLGLAFRAAGREESEARLWALSSALIWAVHPLATSAVNYLSQRPEIMMGLFFFLTMYMVHRSVTARQGQGWWRLGAVAACLLGMGSKESMAATPFLALAYDRIFLSASWKETLRKRGVFYLLLATTLIWPVGRQLAFSPHLSGQRHVTQAFWMYPLTQAWSLVHMTGLALWPHPLIVDYGVQMIDRPAEIWVSLLLVLLALLALVWALKRHPRLGFIGLCFFGILAPSSSFFPVIGQPVAEHRMYVPLASLVILFALGIYQALHVWFRQPAAQTRTTFAWIIALWALALGLASRQRHLAYQDTIRLWSDTALKRPANGRAWSNLARALSKAGRADEALAAAREGVRVAPYLAESHNTLGVIYFDMGRHEESLEHYREAIRTDPTYVSSYSNYGIALDILGRTEESLVQHRIAVRLQPAFAQGHVNLATALARSQRLDEAIEHLHLALGLQPDNALAHNNLGNCLCELRRSEEALAHYREALRLDPDFIMAAANLGSTLIELGHAGEAMDLFDDFARRRTNPMEAWNALASMMIRKGHGAEGLALSLRVLERQPDHPLALNNAAWVMAVSTNPALRDGPKAVAMARQALEVLGHENASLLATLAAAHAEASQFSEAVATARRALNQAQKQGETNQIAKARARLDQFRGGRPWRE
ncbi:MAG: tetratricopeptide repeat protein [Kiritimatiellae bacterium]|nr:tetratricopeptide repeat protein [Kiritimatiellia bacterium]